MTSIETNTSRHQRMDGRPIRPQRRVACRFQHLIFLNDNEIWGGRD
jgi:hypothetical protein